MPKYKIIETRVLPWAADDQWGVSFDLEGGRYSTLFYHTENEANRQAQRVGEFVEFLDKSERPFPKGDVGRRRTTHGYTSDEVGTAGKQPQKELPGSDYRLWSCY
jgi:hypothetical protein